MTTFNEIKVELNFFEPILGSSPADKEIYSKYILGKLEEQGIVMPDSKKQDEINAINPQDEIDNKVTVFPRMADGRVCFWDYQIRGFFKGACGMLRNAPGTESAKLKNYKKKIDGLVFVNERMVPIEYSGNIDIFQRPLRAQTMQGDRVALAMSERVPAGAKVQFTIRLLDPDMAAVVYEWLDYGRYNGLGQFRNGSFGRFEWKDITNEVVEDIPTKVEEPDKPVVDETPIKVELKKPEKKPTAKKPVKVHLEDLDFLSKVKELRSEGLSDIQIAHKFDMKTSDFRNVVTEVRARLNVVNTTPIEEVLATASKKRGRPRKNS